MPGIASAQSAPQLLPNTVKLIAGGGAAVTAGAKCPSGNVSTDAYGDGCLATEVKLVQPRYAVMDRAGNIFFSDYGNYLVRRIDAVTGIVSTITGAGKTPGTGSACTGGGTSTDSDGDGCISTAVSIGVPTGLAFDAAGNLYFADEKNDYVREIAATGGLVPATGGIITKVVGNSSDTYGYNVNNTSATPVVAATNGYLDYPFGITFDTAGNLYIAVEGDEAIQVVNLTGASETLQGLVIPAGTTAKIIGYGNYSAKTLTADCPDFTSTSSRGGCYYGGWVEGSLATTQPVDAPVGVALDKSGNVFFANEYNNNGGLITPANIVTTYIGKPVATGATAPYGTSITRAPATSFAIGSTEDVATDSTGNVYVSDALNGVVWRIDADTKTMYAVAGGAGKTGNPYQAVCSTQVDAYGDGCTGLATKFGSSGTSYAATITTGSPGISGVSSDAYSDVLVGDSVTALVRMVASGTNFGFIGGATTDSLLVHFGVNDGPAASGAYTVLLGGAIFTVGTPGACTANADGSTDCAVPLTATPKTLGQFSGSLLVTSKMAKTATFPLTGVYVSSPLTNVIVKATASSTCSNTTTYAAGTAFTLTATVVATGTVSGSVQFYDAGVALGTPVMVVNDVATMVTNFSTASGHSITAAYSGDTYYTASTSATPATFTTANPSFTITAIPESPQSVKAGGTGLFAFNVAGNVYAGTVSFACSNLPAGASCVFSPQTITATGCTATSTVALNILTQQATPIKAGAMGSIGRGMWNMVAMFAGLGLALAVGLRRRTMRPWMRALGMMIALAAAGSGLVSCSSGAASTAATPTGTFSVVVTATGTGTGGGAQTAIATLTVM